MAGRRKRIGVAVSSWSAIVVAMALWTAWAPPAYAAAGDLDATFGIDGKVTTDFTPRADVAYPIAVQADGKIVAAGQTGGRNPKWALARYETDGSLDTTFGGDGKVTTDFSPFDDVAYGLAIQPDGKIVAAGTAAYRRFALARYNADGSLDTTFGGDGKVTTDLTRFDDFAFALALQPDGKMVLAGDAGGGGPNGKIAVVRYDPDGSLDTTFGGDGKVTTDFTSHPEDGLAMAIGSDGKILVVGGNGFELRDEDFALARYNPDGSLDTSFGGDGKVTTDFTGHPDVAFGVVLQPDGRIVVAGGVGLGPFNPKFGLARYNTDGSLDTSFGVGGKVTTDFTRDDDDAYSIALQDDGMIVAVGQSGGRNPKFALARYNTDGSLDTSFGEGGKVTTDFTEEYDSAYYVLIQADGRIVVAGTAGFAEFALARYLAS